ncbi:MAG: hypothetical protein K0S16_314 [Moraxellaceae bacterium]|jgi:signal transduction histidine kinase|nr:hypothetical protein [Moraxellaceae bacterium]
MNAPPPEIPALKNSGLPLQALPPEGEPASVLIVDDDPAMLASLTATVAGMGLQVVGVRSGREALRQLLQRDFALVLLDINMPGMDGYETAELIHGRPRSAHLPIIFVTAEVPGERARFRGYTLGAVDFIHSPLPEILRAKVQVFTELYYLNRQLRQQADALRKRSEEVNRKNLELEQASRMKSEFLATMSHELRTPLNAIIGFADAMKSGLTGEMTPQQQEYLGDILAGGEHLLSLINDILDLSKIEAGKMELRPDDVEIVPLLESCLTVIRERALRRGVDVELQAEVEGSIRADHRSVRQIVYNLLSNAEKFTPEGGRVRLEARRVPRSVPEQTHCVLKPPRRAATQHYLEIRVCDTGIGMSEAERKRLFRPFVQLDSSLARQYEGTGLGLALVKQLVQLHHGCLAVQSETGKGSTFTVWLPFPPDSPPGDVLGALQPGDAAPPPAGQRADAAAVTPGLGGAE